MTNQSKFRQPTYLDVSHEPKHRIRCSIHGFIRYSDSERALIDHPVFRRLRYIRQLALTEFVYPGATHTRFEHSLGVMEMATRIFDRLAAENGSEMEETFAEVESLRDNTMEKARMVCRLAALLHDTGHCCFSHAAESVIHAGSDHESLTAKLLRSREQLGGLLDTKFFEGCSALTASLIKRPVGFAPQLQLLRDIVSGQIDADRSDYLLRDSYHCGVDYGRFDFRRLIECLTVWRNEDSGELVMGIQRDGIHSIESLILARYQMNTQVYFHRLRRIYDIYLERYFGTLDKSEFDCPEKILEWNDVKALNRLFTDSSDSDRPGYQWAKRIVDRLHHRDVFALDEGDGPNAVKVGKTIFKTVRNEFPDIEFIEDFSDEPFSIHKIARDDDRDAKLIDFPLVERGRRTSLGQRSQILKSLPTTFRVGFIFADVYDTGLRKSISERCRQIRNENS